jgi:hypothetical protein
VCQVISQVQDKQLPATRLLPLLLQLLPDLSLVLPWLHSTNQTTIFNKKERMTDFIKGHVKKCHIHATNRISLRNSSTFPLSIMWGKHNSVMEKNTLCSACGDNILNKKFTFSFRYLISVQQKSTQRRSTMKDRQDSTLEYLLGTVPVFQSCTLS